MEEGEDIEEGKKKKSRAEAHGLKKPQVLSGFIDVDDASVAVAPPTPWKRACIQIT